MSLSHLKALLYSLCLSSGELSFLDEDEKESEDNVVATIALEEEEKEYEDSVVATIEKNQSGVPPSLVAATTVSDNDWVA